MVAEVREWLHRLRREDRATLLAVSDALTVLRVVGPGLGRPLVDRVSQSSLHHLKELRPGSAGSAEVRILFAFDPFRRAVLLVAGDKAGRWNRWYDEAIPLAEQRYAEYMAEVTR
ncbi:MAG TPA: addiction module toxin RelE [Actinobacteria bacterium]|nr:addiction module toxin RelE [Actinomycetota bacterium]